MKCIKTPVFIETSGFFIRSALFSIDERRILKLPNVCGGGLPEFNGQIGKTDVIELTLSGVYAKIIKVTEKRKNLAGMCFFGGLVSFGGKLRKLLGSKQKENPTTNTVVGNLWQGRRDLAKALFYSKKQ